MSDHTHKSPERKLSHQTADTGRTSPGKGTLVEQAYATAELVQRGMAAPSPAADTIHAKARDGIAGASERLPHLDRIQQLFGGHDVTNIKAHSGASAAEASRQIGAHAYATGDHVAFCSSPDLHTAAHEAAHVVQQRAGIQLEEGVGQTGDAYERHADAVADAVVAGRPADGLLDEMAPHGAPAQAPLQRQVQRRPAELTADALIARHKGDPAGLAAEILDTMTSPQGASVCDQVFDRAPDKPGLFAALAAQLPNSRLRDLYDNGSDHSRKVLMRIPLRLREFDNVKECERMISVLVDPQHAHLVSETTSSSKQAKEALSTHQASTQSITEGWGPIVYDYYWIVMDTMPSKLTPEAYLAEMGQDLNKAVQDDTFNTINVFERTKRDANRGAPQVGDIYDIDIKGPDNGSVLLVEQTASHFIFQTVTTQQTGTHPEYGSREFGFERIDEGAVKWYTRGASRAGNELAATIGGPIQELGWTSMLTGIGNTLVGRGGVLRHGSFGHWIRRS